MRNTAFLLTGLVLLLIQGNLFRVLHWIRVPGLVPSLVLPLVLFMGVHEYSLARGASISFLLGYATDVVGIAPVGLFAFTYVAIFVLARAVGVRLAAQTVMTQIGLALAFALVHSVMILVLVAIFGRDAYLPRALYPMTVPHVLSTAVVAPFIFRTAQRIHTATVVGSRTEEGGGRP